MEVHESLLIIILNMILQPFDDDVVYMIIVVKPLVTLCMMLWQQIHFFSNGAVFPNKSPYFKHDMHKVTVRRIYRSIEPHSQFCSDQCAQVNYIISVVYVTLSYPSANVT